MACVPSFGSLAYAVAHVSVPTALYWHQSPLPPPCYMVWVTSSFPSCATSYGAKHQCPRSSLPTVTRASEDSAWLVLVPAAQEDLFQLGAEPEPVPCEVCHL